MQIRQKFMGKKYISLEEANDLLEVIRPKLKMLKQLEKAIAILDTLEIVFSDEFLDLQANVKLSRKFHKLYAEYYKEIDYLLSNGCIVKDVSKGLVDFYSLYNGKEILLCWKFGEEEIGYWHDVDCGVKGRKPISLLKNG